MTNGGSFLELVTVAKMRRSDIFFRGPDGVLTMDGEEKAHGPRAIPMSALMINFDRTIVGASVAEIVDHVPKRDATDDWEILEIVEAFSFVEVIDDISTCAILLRTLKLHRDFHISGKTWRRNFFDARNNAGFTNAMFSSLRRFRRSQLISIQNLN